MFDGLLIILVGSVLLTAVGLAVLDREVDRMREQIRNPWGPE